MMMEENMQNSREDKVRLRAYQIWEEEGRPEGEDLAHWHRADSEIEPEHYQMPAEQDARPSEAEETESVTQAMQAPQAPQALSSDRVNARRQRASLSGAVADNRQDAANSGS
jgi:hypothetical protein